MGLADDLSEAVVAELLPDRELHVYEAILSTEADAIAWARAGGPEGAVVVADYQASPRGRAGLPWEVTPGLGLSFSLVLRPDLPVSREGWLYTLAVSAIADVAGDDTRIEWPDEVYRGDTRVGATGVHVELGPDGTEWATITVLMEQAEPPRAPLLAELVTAIERRYQAPTDMVLSDYLSRCSTLGRRVRARLVPLGPAGPVIIGEAVDSLDDGALIVVTDKKARVGVLPQHLGLLEPDDEEPNLLED